jgi:pectinesterase
MLISRLHRRNSVAVLAGVVVMAWAGLASGASYYLDPNYTGVNGAPFGDYAAAYNSISAALGSSGVPAGSSPTNPNRLYIAPGTYNTATTGSTAGISYSKANVALIGITGNANDVVITSTLDSAFITSGTTTIGTSGSATLQLKGNNQSAANITFANSTDTPYIIGAGHQMAVSPGGTYTGNSQTSSAPAVALLLQGDEQAFNNVKVLGYQDSLYTKGGRSYFTNSTISGDDDFIFANGTTVINNSNINIDGDHSGGAITAPSTDKRTSNGIVFLNDTISGSSVHGNAVIDSQNAANVNGPAANSTYLGRPWYTQTGGDASAVYINDKMSSAIKSVGWLNWDNTELNSPANNMGNLAEDARFAEFGSMDLLGNPLDVSQRVSWSHQMTAAEAANYTVNNLFASEAGFSWYGKGYPAGDTEPASSTPSFTTGTGSADPTNPNFSYPAFWGDRNVQDEGNASMVTGDPNAYSNPSWTLGGNWDANAQIALIPEPTSAALGFGAVALLGLRRKRR